MYDIDIWAFCRLLYVPMEHTDDILPTSLFNIWSAGVFIYLRNTWYLCLLVFRAARRSAGLLFATGAIEETH